MFKFSGNKDIRWFFLLWLICGKWRYLILLLMKDNTYHMKLINMTTSWSERHSCSNKKVMNLTMSTWTHMENQKLCWKKSQNQLKWMFVWKDYWQVRIFKIFGENKERWICQVTCNDMIYLWMNWVKKYDLTLNSYEGKKHQVISFILSKSRKLELPDTHIE